MNLRLEGHESMLRAFAFHAVRLFIQKYVVYESYSQVAYIDGF